MKEGRITELADEKKEGWHPRWQKVSVKLHMLFLDMLRGSKLHDLPSGAEKKGNFVG